MRTLPIGIVALSLVPACSSSPEPKAINMSPPPPASASTPAPIDEARVADPAAGRAGWFAIVGDERTAHAAKLADGRCIAADDYERWLVTPSGTGGPCDGVATRLPGLPRNMSEVVVAAEQVIFSGLGELFVADRPDGPVSKLETPFERAPHIAIAGGVLLASDKEKKLYRLEGKTFVKIPLDGGRVRSFVGTANAGYAITEKRGLYASFDRAKTWKPLKHDFVSVDYFSAWPTSATTQRVVLVGKGRGPDGQPYGAEAELESSDPLTVFSGAEIHRPLPKDVTNRDGVPLDVFRAARDSLTVGRRCWMTSMLGSQAAAACADDNGSYVLVSEDGGQTVMEIHRDKFVDRVVQLVVAKDEIFVLRACEYGMRTNDACLERQVMILARRGEGWEPRTVPIEKSDHIDTVVFDRTGGGGFYAFGQMVSATDNETKPVVYHTGASTSRYTPRLTTRGFPPTLERSTLIGAHVGADGDPRLLLIGTAKAAPAQPVIGHFRLSSRLDVVASKPVGIDPSQFRLSTYEQIGVHRERVVWFADDHILYVSEDGGGAVRKTSPDALRATLFLQQRSVQCGSAGCDFDTGQVGISIAWRWGDGPMDATLAEGKSTLSQ